MADSETKRDRRDETLWRLLPRKDAVYDFDRLSEAETHALVEALADGFGEVLVPDREAQPLPRILKAGLLQHSFYVERTQEYDADDWDNPFWTSANNDDAPPPSEWFPLGFVRRRLRIYFQNQFNRFCAQTARELKMKVTTRRDKSLFEELAFDRLYQKPWYEVHALQFLDWIENRETLKYPGLALVANAGFSGQLGRLVEQYFWRFRFEQAAIIGVGAQKGASAGGKARAAIHHAERVAWQKVAFEIWSRRPKLSKTAVAEKIRDRLRSPHTAKHIARYIRQS